MFAGICHFAAINLLSGNFAFASLDWSASFLVVLGILVLFRFRLAMVVTRLLGSFTIVGLVLAVVLIVAGFSDGGELTYGAMTVVDPAPWQIITMLSVVALTLLPPWYALQRIFADNHAVHRSGVNAFPDG